MMYNLSLARTFVDTTKVVYVWWEFIPDKGYGELYIQCIFSDKKLLQFHKQDEKFDSEEAVTKAIQNQVYDFLKECSKTHPIPFYS